jgi:hypothetical protein
MTLRSKRKVTHATGEPQVGEGIFVMYFHQLLKLLLQLGKLLFPLQRLPHLM